MNQYLIETFYYFLVSITDSKKGPKAPKSGKRQAKDQEEVNVSFLYIKLNE